MSDAIQFLIFVDENFRSDYDGTFFRKEDADKYGKEEIGLYTPEELYGKFYDRPFFQNEMEKLNTKV